LQLDEGHIRTSIDPLSKSADVLNQMQQHMQATVALIERTRTLKLGLLR
jgi:hypothetical protein